jgi:hypothetical protein
MSEYSRTFNASFSVTGGNAVVAVHSGDIIPLSTSSTSWGHHYHGALQVELVRCSATLVCNDQGSNSAPFAAIGFSGPTAPTSTHQLASIGSLAAPSATASVSGSPGLRRVLKGVLDAGDAPTLYVALGTTWDSTKSVLGIVTLSWEAKFTGISALEGITSQLPVLTK